MTNGHLKNWETALGMRLVNNAADHACVKQISVGNCSFIYRCEPWSGVYLWFNQVRDRTLQSGAADFRFVTVNYCLSGRCEVALSDDTYIYMEPGMLSIDSRTPVDGYYYPTGSYTGLELAFDLDLMGQNPPAGLLDYGDFPNWMRKLTEESGGSCTASVSESCRNRMQELCTVLQKHSLRIEDYRYQALSLLIDLERSGITPMAEPHYVTKGQRRIVAEIEQRITRDLSMHYTITDLAKEYGISASALKQYFEKVYGLPISHYLRDLRMTHAQQLLKETTMKIGEVAASCGYSHQGKFGAVFRETTGMNPLEYRRLNYHSKGENNTETE